MLLSAEPVVTVQGSGGSGLDAVGKCWSTDMLPCPEAEKATYGEAILIVSFGIFGGLGVSRSVDRFGLRFKVRSGDTLGESDTAQLA